MRVCPVCHARAFDDAEVCYGCMHRFSGKEPAAALMPGGAHKGGAVGPLPQEAQMRAQAASSGANAASWADARQAALPKGRSAEQLPRPVPTGDVFEQLVGVHDADRQTYRDHDPQIAEPPARHVVPAGHQQLHEPLDGEQREAHDEENPHRVVLGGAYQPQGVSRGEGLDDDRNDEQDFDQHRPDYLLYCKYTIISALRQALRADGNPSDPPARAPPRRNRATRPIRRCPAPPAPR